MALCFGIATLSVVAALPVQPTVLPTPGFHHLHLNSVNPEAAIAFYTKHFPTTSATTFAGQPALRSPNNVLVLFTTVATPPATQPPTAFWHFGWHVTDVRKSLETYKQNGATILPLYTGDGGTVYVSSDTWPGTGGVLGLTLDGIAHAKAQGVKPAGGAGFMYQNNETSPKRVLVTLGVRYIPVQSSAGKVRSGDRSTRQVASVRGGWPGRALAATLSRVSYHSCAQYGWS